MSHARPFIDLFSDEPALYASARPHYPAALFQCIADAAPARARVWDCGTGNGQAAVALARHFDAVCASDPSGDQIAHAVPHARVTYSVQPAEATDFVEASFDAVCVAQALHWFDHAAFFREARRVLRPGGLFAAWGYSWFQVEPAIDAVVQRDLLDVLAGNWAPEVQHLWRGYRELDMPFDELPAPRLQIDAHWHLAQLLAYVRSWSATKRHVAQHGDAFLRDAAARLLPLWGDAQAPRAVVMPLHLRMGRMNGAAAPA